MSELCEPAGLTTAVELIERMRARQERIPLGLTVDLTHRCNFRCAHCFCRLPEDGLTPEPELSLAEWDRIFGEGRDEGVLFVTFTGGEPLLREDFRELWVAAKRRGFLVELFTNAALLTPELCDFLAEWTPQLVSVSVYAATEATYQRMTGRKGMLARVLRSLDLLGERSIPFNVKCLFSRVNAHEFLAVRELLLGYDELFLWQADLVGSYPNGVGNPENVRLSPAEIVELELADPERSQTWREKAAEWRPAPKRPGRPFPCTVGTIRFHIDPYGSLRPCLLLEGCRYDLRSGSVREGWREAIPRMVANFDGVEGPCEVCELAELCRVCPAHALLAGCAPAGPSPFHCQLARERAEAYGVRAELRAT